MIRLIKYFAVFALGFFVAKYFYESKSNSETISEVQIISDRVKNLSKLVVTETNLAEIYSFSDSKKYFYDYIQFDKKAILSVNAKVEIGYNLSDMSIELDTIQKKIIINEIPNQEISIIPDIKYFDLQESQFNTFSTKDLNSLNEKAIERIRGVIATNGSREQAKERLFAELSSIYQLSKHYNWEVVDKTNKGILERIKL